MYVPVAKGQGDEPVPPMQLSLHVLQAPFNFGVSLQICKTTDRNQAVC
jgi:hypothetical protein